MAFIATAESSAASEPAVSKVDAYIENLQLGCNSYYVHQQGEDDKGRENVLISVYDNRAGGGYETQSWLTFQPDDTVAWTTVAIYESEGLNALFRGRCVWFNGEEMDADFVKEHNSQFDDIEIVGAEAKAQVAA